MVNEAIKLSDPYFYAKAIEVRSKVEKQYPITRAYGINDPLVVEGREILFNRQSGLHTNPHDPPRGFAGLLALGDFVGGDLYLPSLRVRLRLEPGDLALIRGRILPHSILSWTGQRISMPHFTHSSVWRDVEMYNHVNAESFLY